MKSFLRVLLLLLVGGFVAYFGVVLSLFGDATQREWLQLIALILLVYLILGLATGFLLQDLSWKGGLILAAPAVVIVLVFKGSDMAVLIYLSLVLALSAGGALLGSRLRTGRRQGP